jgi:hypothetical protein
MNANLIGPLSGTIAVVLVGAALLIGGQPPGIDASSADVVAFYADTSSAQQLAGGLFGLGCVALLFFLGALHHSLRVAAGDQGLLAMAVVMGGLMIAVGLSLFGGIGFTLGDAVDDLPASATVTLHVLNSDLFVPLSVGVAAFNLGLGLSILRFGGLPRPLGLLALVIAIACVSPAGYAAFLATSIVIVWSSAVLTMQSAVAGVPVPDP